MKKAIFVVLLGLLIFSVPALYAQDLATNKESEYYYISIPIEKIYVHRDGYVVLYQKGFSLVRTFIPMEWFENPTGRADLVQLGTGSSWPHFSVYYKNGAFSHVRLYVRKSFGHETWGTLPFNANIDQYFRSIEDIPLVD